MANGPGTTVYVTFDGTGAVNQLCYVQQNVPGETALDVSDTRVQAYLNPPAATLTARGNTSAQDLIGNSNNDVAIAVRSAVLVIQDWANTVATWAASVNTWAAGVQAAVATATTLLTLQTKFAALTPPGLPPAQSTPAQLKTAILNKIAAGGGN